MFNIAKLIYTEQRDKALSQQDMLKPNKQLVVNMGTLNPTVPKRRCYFGLLNAETNLVQLN